MELSAYAFRVLCHLKRRADHSGKAFPGMRSIAQKCCLSVSTVCRAVKELQTRGVLRVEARGENVSNLYLLTSPDEWKSKDGRPFQHTNKVRPPRGEAVSIRNGGVSIANTPVSRGNGPVSDRNGRESKRRESKEGDPLKGIQKKAIQEKTTTTPCACAPEAEPMIPDKAVVVVSSGSGFEAEEKRRHQRLAELSSQFCLNPSQANELHRIAKDPDKGMAYIEEKAQLTLSEPRDNAAAFFVLALERNWKPKVKIAKQPKSEPTPQKPPEPLADFSAEMTWWQSATDAQREDILRDPRFDLYRKSMRKGVTAASLGLPVLRQVLAELAQEASRTATVLEKAQQPEAAAA
ncbi:MAG: helix-turn-helix domain-containing protein [Acetobacteraceae bacterium]|nr:helix-turn-helix domain-containing protein [Acetobacteraceae bacterium]